jgi:Zn finger protein HypA/HybF involved in hydrogenase expression
MGNKEKVVIENRDNIIHWFAIGITATEVCTKLGGMKLCTLKNHCINLGIEWKTHPGSYQLSKVRRTVLTLDEAIKRGSRKETIKKLTIEERGHRCEKCGLSEWLYGPIPLEIHHINGKAKDHRRENIQILCPNCHSLTDNFCGKNITKKPVLIKQKREKQSALSKEEISQRVDIIKSIDTGQYGWVMQAASQLGVSHACIRRFVNKYMPEFSVKRRKSPILV